MNTGIDWNSNLISKRWKERYDAQPEEIKAKLDALSDSMPDAYQLQVIKRTRKYPEIGDVFRLRTKPGIEYQGLVVNCHFTFMTEENLIVILIFKAGIDIKRAVENGIRREDTLIAPAIVGKGYWTMGFFENFGHVDIRKKIDYGFLDVQNGNFYDEYENRLQSEPELMGFYGITTYTGIAKKITTEMIIAGLIREVPIAVSGSGCR